MRTLTPANPLDPNRSIIQVLDTPGPGNACHQYQIIGNDIILGHINFIKGPIHTPSHQPGITNEDLLAILIDRMESFQSGKFTCPENADALDYLRYALECLTIRTSRRTSQGIEGTHTPDPVAPTKSKPKRKPPKRS